MSRAALSAGLARGLTAATLLLLGCGGGGGPAGGGQEAEGTGAPEPATEPSTDQHGWHAAYDPAAELARATGRDLLVDFTGSDWCAPCEKLEAEVLSTDAFRAAVDGDFVLVRLDFPRAPAAMDRVPDRERNEALRVAHFVNDFPTLLLVDPTLGDGDGVGGVFGRFGYLAGGPDPTLGVIEAARRQRDEVRGLLTAERPERARALELLREDPSQLLAARLVEIAQPLAFEGQDGACREVLAVLAAAGPLDEQAMARAVELDPENAEGLYLAAVRAALAGATAPEAVRAAVDWADRLANDVGVMAGAEAAEVGSRAAGWAHGVLSDRVRARWFATLALQAGELPDPVRRRMEAISSGR